MALNLSTAVNWVFRTGALRNARSSVSSPDERSARLVGHVKLLLEVAYRVIEPAQELPTGSRPAVLLSLYRDAAYWMLAAMAGGELAPPNLATLWTVTKIDRLLEATGGDPEGLESVRQMLVEWTPATSLNASSEDAERVRSFVEALVWTQEAPKRAVDRLIWQRWLRLGAVAGVLVLGFLGAKRLVLGRNLAEGKPLRTSSSHPSCQPHDCADLLFHTMIEQNPWVEIDLAAARNIHRVEVSNRSDCCEERAVPLVVEISIDEKKWTEVARRNEQFSHWNARFPSVSARYVRLRVPRETALHLEAIAIR
jgi:hypothetical protein